MDKASQKEENFYSNLLDPFFKDIIQLLQVRLHVDAIAIPLYSLFQIYEQMQSTAFPFPMYLPGHLNFFAFQFLHRQVQTYFRVLDYWKIKVA